jgi:hypothetical protein
MEIAGDVFRRAFMIQPGTLQHLKVPGDFTDLLSKQGIISRFWLGQP